MGEEQGKRTEGHQFRLAFGGARRMRRQEGQWPTAMLLPVSAPQPAPFLNHFLLRLVQGSGAGCPGCLPADELPRGG